MRCCYWSRTITCPYRKIQDYWPPTQHFLNSSLLPYQYHWISYITNMVYGCAYHIIIWGDIRRNNSIPTFYGQQCIIQLPVKCTSMHLLDCLLRFINDKCKLTPYCPELHLDSHWVCESLRDKLYRSVAILIMRTYLFQGEHMMFRSNTECSLGSKDMV